MKETLKNIGYFALGVGALILLAVLSALMIKGTVWVGEHVLQWLINLAWFTFALDLFILLPLGLFRKTGFVGGIGMSISSYVFGLTLWFFGLLLTYFIWGFWGVFIGLALYGVGVVPVAMLAVLIDGDFVTLGTLVLLTVFTFGTRALGIYLAVRAEENKNTQYEEIIPESTDKQISLSAK